MFLSYPLGTFTIMYSLYNTILMQDHHGTLSVLFFSFNFLTDKFNY
jgi:hypothetical protein